MRNGTDGDKSNSLSNRRRSTWEGSSPSQCTPKILKIQARARRNGSVPMRAWNTKEANIALEWAKTSEEKRCSIQDLAKRLGRSPKAIVCFLSRRLPPGHRPWIEKRRWSVDEAAAIEDAQQIADRTAAAIRIYKLRKQQGASDLREDDAATDDAAYEEETCTIDDVAAIFGVSPRTIYRWMGQKYLRRWKGGLSWASITRLIREHPELIPYKRMPLEYREWFVLHGYPDADITVKVPTADGVLEN